MRQVNSTDFKRQFDELLDLARDEPIIISKSGKPLAMLMPSDQFAYLQKLDDLYWTVRAKATEDNHEWISHEEAMALLLGRLSEDK